MRLLALTCCFLTVAVALGEKLTVATVDLQRLFKEFPGTRRAQKKFDALTQEKKQDLADLEKVLKILRKELDGSKDKLSPEDKKRKEMEFEAKTRDYQEETNHFQEELTQRDQDVTQGLLDQIKDIVAGIAQKEGIDLVLDSKDSVAVKGERDLTGEVLKQFSKLKANPMNPDLGTP